MYFEVTITQVRLIGSISIDQMHTYLLGEAFRDSKAPENGCEGEKTPKRQKTRLTRLTGNSGKKASHREKTVEYSRKTTAK